MLVPQAFSFRDRFSPRQQSGRKVTINYAPIDARHRGKSPNEMHVIQATESRYPILLFPFSDDLSFLYEKSLRARTVIVHL